ncbi:MAG: pyridoxal 5'-phosphate synthase glutaminase subunit PdxT [Coriobacteriales bacterium]|jgi:5'-phosphate synthase pdxT subunit|nr:pyridoxal 5'-phosphate synthase glutaminase subunit PdxT [Coriobacteriales bacterium]
MNIGILALQGAFIEHRHALDALGARSFEIRQLADFDPNMDGLIIPGGESTVIGKLLVELHLLEPLKRALASGLPIFGTCAGMILLSQRVANSDQHYLDALDTTVRRNAYGRQLASFQASTHFKGIGALCATFIRAPYVEQAGPAVEVLATVDEKIVAVRQGSVLATAFHPELSPDTRVHEYFLKMIC